MLQKRKPIARLEGRFAVGGLHRIRYRFVVAVADVLSNEERKVLVMFGQSTEPAVQTVAYLVGVRLFASCRLCVATTAFVVVMLFGDLPSACGQNWVVSEKRDGLLFFSETSINVDGIANELKSLRKELNNVVKVESAKTQVELIIFRSHASYQQYLKNTLPDALQRRAIFYRRGDTFQIYSWNHRELLKDLRHEYTHALLHQVLPYVPLWVDEGLAEYFEDRPGTRLKSSRFASVKWKTRTGWKPSLLGLERIPSASRMSQQDYMNSWAWVAYLLNDSPESFTTFRAYLNAISIGEAPGAFSEYLAERAPGIPNQVGSYFRKIRISLR